MRVLDVGCGNGEFLKRAKGLGWEVYGLDFDPKAVTAAQASGIHATVGDLESARYPSEHFDAVTMSHVIEHLHDPVEALREVPAHFEAGRHGLDRDAEYRKPRPLQIRTELERT